MIPHSFATSTFERRTGSIDTRSAWIVYQSSRSVDVRSRHLGCQPRSGRKMRQSSSPHLLQ
ncbi:unnamed protein product, partial [Brassica rapa subsp. trilocularis]